MVNLRENRKKDKGRIGLSVIRRKRIMISREILSEIVKLCGEAVPGPVSLRYDEPMYRHTTFKAGGPADLWVRPGKEVFPEYSAALLKTAAEAEVPVFILGAGANILVSDRGIRGIVLDTASWKGIGVCCASCVKPKKIADQSIFCLANSVRTKGPRSPDNRDFLRHQAQKIHKRNRLIGKREDRETPPEAGAGFSVKVCSGTSVDGLVDRLTIRGLSGLEFLAGMPGLVGGALWMNARCYEKSVSDVLLETEILDEELKRIFLPFNAGDFGYKKSPFQNRKVLILSARFAVTFRAPQEIRKEVAGYRRDRKEKGHYRYPSAGSAFKNNRAFGAPTGQIIDSLGLKGLRSGDAQVAPWHGNIIINTGYASAADIRSLMDEVRRRVKEERGFDLESEIVFAGDWEQRDDRTGG
jgi:UDP-N-acetylmuramate dehydrogenase